MHWRKLAMEHMINTPKRRTAFNGNQVRDMLDDADRRAVAPLVCADPAQLSFSQVTAANAATHRGRGFLERRDEFRQTRWFFHEQMQRDPLGRSVAQSRKLLQVLL